MPLNTTTLIFKFNKEDRKLFNKELRRKHPNPNYKYGETIICNDFYFGNLSLSLYLVNGCDKDDTPFINPVIFKQEDGVRYEVEAFDMLTSINDELETEIDEVPYIIKIR